MVCVIISSVVDWIHGFRPLVFACFKHTSTLPSLRLPFFP